MNKKLEPCPTCGSKDLRVTIGGMGYVECLGCRMRSSSEPSEMDAAYSWNKLARAATKILLNAKKR